MVAYISDRVTRDQKIAELPAHRSPIFTHLSRYRLIYPGAIRKIEARKTFDDQPDLIHIFRPRPVAIHFLQCDDIRPTDCCYDTIEVNLTVASATKLYVVSDNFQNVATIDVLVVFSIFYPNFTPHLKLEMGLDP